MRGGSPVQLLSSLGREGHLREGPLVTTRRGLRTTADRSRRMAAIGQQGTVPEPQCARPLLRPGYITDSTQGTFPGGRTSPMCPEGSLFSCTDALAPSPRMPAHDNTKAKPGLLDCQIRGQSDSRPSSGSRNFAISVIPLRCLGVRD